MTNIDEYTLNEIISYCDIDTVVVLNVLNKQCAKYYRNVDKFGFYSRYTGILNNSKRIAKDEYSKYTKIQPDYLKCCVAPACKHGHIEMIEFIIDKGMTDWCQWLFDIHNEKNPKLKQVINKYTRLCTRCCRSLEEHYDQ